MNNFFPYSLKDLTKKKKILIIFALSLLMLTILVEAIFLIVQNRSNSLIFFILMLIIGILTAIAEIYMFSFVLPIINQLIYLAERKEKSPNESVGIFLRKGNRIMFRHLEVIEYIFIEDDIEITYIALKENQIDLKENQAYKINHANQFLFEVEENEN